MKVPSDFQEEDAAMASYVHASDKSGKPFHDSRKCSQCGSVHKYVIGGSPAGQIWRCLNCGTVNRTR